MKGSNYDMASVMEQLAKSGKLTTNDKRWIAAAINKQHERDIELKIMDIMATDSEFKYFIGVTIGAGTGFLGSMLKKSGAGDPTSGIAPVDTAVNAWEWVLGIGSPLGGVAVDLFQGGSAEDQAADILRLSGGGYAAWCASVLMLKAIGGDAGALGAVL